MDKRVYGVLGISAIMANWNADFSGYPKTTPSIGLLLCKSKNNLVAEYSLKDISKPIDVGEYKVTSNLTGELEKQLPSVEDIQNRIK